MPLSETPLLVVNADDFGWNRNATDRTVECFRQRLITGATLMTYMEDGERAAQLGLQHDLPLGLHLNLTDPFTDASAPAAIRERQAAACRVFGRNRLRLRSWTYDPRVRTVVADAVRDQLARFRTLLGAEPTHVDGHNHVQICPNVIASAPLRGLKMRNALWSWPTTPTGMGRARDLRRRITGRNHLTPRYFFDLSELHRLEPAVMAGRLGVARSTSAEVMAHPGFGHELDALRDPAWAQALSTLPIGTYQDLA